MFSNTSVLITFSECKRARIHQIDEVLITEHDVEKCLQRRSCATLEHFLAKRRSFL